MQSRRTVLAALPMAALVAAAGVPAFAGDVIEVRMLNRDPDSRATMVYSPSIIRAQPGDVIRFLSTDRGHNVESIDGGLPEGVESFRSKLSEDYDLEVTAEGTYAVKCTPHYATGMVALILVGDHAVNYEDVKSVGHRGRAARVFDELYARVEEGV